MFLKSKWVWIATVLSVCTLSFLGQIVYQTNYTPKVIKVYKATVTPQPVTPQSPEESSAPVPTQPAPHDAATKMDTFDDTSIADFSEDASDDTDAFTHTADDLFTAEQFHPDTDAALEVDTDAEAEAEAAYVAQQIAELRIKIPQALQERLDLFYLIEELAEFTMEDEEPYALRMQLQEEARELRKTIFLMSNQYIHYTRDYSPFEPSGEFYDLLEQNHMGIRKAVR